LAQLRPGLPDLIGELLLGLVLGVASSLLVSAVQLAAGLVDVQAGFTFGATLDPFAGYAAGPIEHFLSAFAIVLFLNLNGHQLFLVALHDLFVIAPIGGLPHLASAGAVSGFFAVIFIAALTMALPIVTMILLIDVALALLSRAAPQFNLFAVGLPARAGVTLVVLATLLPVIATQLGQLYSQLPNVLPVVTRQ
jgi:flagellar biosynthetic protein FliR